MSQTARVYAVIALDASSCTPESPQNTATVPDSTCSLVYDCKLSRFMVSSGHVPASFDIGHGLYHIVCSLHMQTVLCYAVQAFEAAYKREYGFVLEHRDIIVDDLRIRATGKVSMQHGCMQRCKHLLIIVKNTANSDE